MTSWKSFPNKEDAMRSFGTFCLAVWTICCSSEFKLRSRDVIVIKISFHQTPSFSKQNGISYPLCQRFALTRLWLFMQAHSRPFEANSGIRSGGFSFILRFPILASRDRFDDGVAIITMTSWWAHGVSNPRRLDCSLNRLFRHRWKETSKLCVTDLCEGNPPVSDISPSQRASYAENVSISWRHHVLSNRLRIGWPDNGLKL